ncbi:hypothetical protein [Streptomyces spiralis]|uniref:hypothetical protein n=1 Tax=Streptomyces spiralis TaxID=66376 RepID=UPI0036B7A1AC
MFRRVRDAVARRFTRPRSNGSGSGDWNLAQEVREPGPYAERLPSPHDARWRRWAERSRTAGHHLPFPRDEECWHIPARPGAPLWEAADDVVRPYVLRR